MSFDFHRIVFLIYKYHIKILFLSKKEALWILFVKRGLGTFQDSASELLCW